MSISLYRLVAMPSFMLSQLVPPSEVTDTPPSCPTQSGVVVAAAGTCPAGLNTMACWSQWTSRLLIGVPAKLSPLSVESQISWNPMYTRVASSGSTPISWSYAHWHPLATDPAAGASAPAGLVQFAPPSTER